MGKLASVLLLCLAFIFGCNCGGGQAYHGVAAPEVVPYGENSDVVDRAITQFITVRTVRVAIDCSAADGVKVISPDYWDPDTDYGGMGTGVILDSADGVSHIVTAAHVVTPEIDDPELLTCSLTVRTQKSLFGTPREFDAEIVASNSRRDLAVISVDDNLGVATTIAKDLFLGQHVWSAGYTSLLVGESPTDISISEGRLATVGLRKSSDEREGYIHRHTAQIYFGNSGGGVWTDSGELVGISILLASFNPPGPLPPVPYEGNYYLKPAEEIELILKEDDVNPWVPFGQPPSF